MFNLKTYRLRKQAREMIHGAKKLVRINRDILDPRLAAEIHAGCDELRAVTDTGNQESADSASRKLLAVVENAFPRSRHAGLRENIEVLLVAAIVAMGVRTFVLQPFKIPTGSMQPTLFGIHQDQNATINPSALKRLADFVLFGKTYHDGGCEVRGDFIFVDKMSYHFRRPQRGEVIVFETGHIPNPRGNFYIKRLIGLGGDTVQLDPPCVRINGEILDERPAFKRIYSRQNGYSGYVIPGMTPTPPFPVLSNRDSQYKVPPRHFLPMGDNSNSSYDGRYWGAVPREDLVGRAVIVYWPFSKRTGLIE